MEQALSIKFKYGKVSVYQLVDPTRPLSEVANDLLDALIERYGDDRTKILGMDSLEIKLPKEASQLAFAVPKSVMDATEGWRPLATTPQDTLASLGIKDGSVLAFAILADGTDEASEQDFFVDIPQDEEDEDLFGKNGDDAKHIKDEG